MSEYFEDIKEILGKEINSLQDFLWKYYLFDMSREDYKSEKRNRRLVEVRVSPAADKDATEKVLEKANLIGYPPIDSPEVKNLKNYIEKFFKALGVDMSIFKKDDHYEMTKEFQDLLRDILDRREISDRVKMKEKKGFDILSTEQTLILFDLLRSAIKKAPCSKEQGEAEIERLYRVLVSENLAKRKSPFHSDVESSKVLREILYTVWDVIMRQGWKPNPKNYISGIYDEHWNTVCEHVAVELYERHLLVIKKLECEGRYFKTIMRLIQEEEVGYALLYNNMPHIPEGSRVLFMLSQEEAEKHADQTCEGVKFNPKYYQEE